MVVNSKILQDSYSELYLQSSLKSIDFINNLFYGINCSPIGDNATFLTEEDYELLIDVVTYYKNGGCTYYNVETILNII